MTLSLLSTNPTIPAAANGERAEVGVAQWREAAERTQSAAIARRARDIAADAGGRRLLAAIYGNSGYLGQCLTQDLAYTCWLVDQGPDTALHQIIAELKAIATSGQGINAAVSALRRLKRRSALAIALADILNIWPLETVLAALSNVADAVLRAAVAVLLRDGEGRKILRPSEDGGPQNCAGYTVIALGKLGAGELNFSSDVDLIAVFDRDMAMARDIAGDPQRTFVRLTGDLVRLLEDRTPEGYVYRTDFRLRPDPGAMPLAMTVAAAETYYESVGQNWERAAMIRARPVAGDTEVGAAFLRHLSPFVWRKHLDFAAIEDIHSIKRQIHTHRGGGTIAVEGHNIKLGRGGIREIEFLVQTQQLIWGGREPRVRCGGTGAAMAALVSIGRMDARVAERLVAAYRFLRRVENRLQMVDDQQTHTLPKSADGIDALATFLGYADGEDFRAELLAHLRAVAEHYGELFERAPPLGTVGNLVFTGGEHDPGTLETLTGLGYRDVSTTVSAWHRGRYRAMRSTRARELLTELTPRLLAALAHTSHPDQAFMRFDGFLAKLPAGVQLFSLFQSNPQLLDLVAEIMGTAPRLATALSTNPLLLDAVLGHDFFQPLPDRDALIADMSQRLRPASDVQDIHELSRRWVNDAKFRIGVQSLRHTIDAAAAGRAHSDVADTAVRVLLPAIAAQFHTVHGACPGDGFAVVALGKYGGRELTAGSDLDLVFLYDLPTTDDIVYSDGEKPLSVSHYFQRFSQRVIGALSALTGEGRLYDIDMRLRPSGNSAPLATSLDAFARYYAEDAWTWEHLALTRARIIAATPEFAGRIAATLRTVLATPRDATALLGAVADMRRQIDAEHHSDNPWNLKYHRGGLIDCEFIAQYLQLRHAHDDPAIVQPNTAAAFDALAAAGALETGVAAELREACRLWLGIQAWLRLTVDGEPDEESWPAPLKAGLARVGAAADFDALKAKVLAIAKRTRHHYQAIIDDPAAKR